MSTQDLTTVIALDIGTIRTGVAIANNISRIARPLMAIDMSGSLVLAVKGVIEEHDAVAIVAGLPRNLSGADTQQTQFVRDQVDAIRRECSIPVYFSDEALTSVKAEDELRARKKPFTKADVDMLAAVFILEDFIATHPEVYEDRKM